MRELRVAGVGPDGSYVICQDPESGEKFGIAADERLRAAARGDLSRLGQIEIEMASSLRPREIQQRIRAGASVAEVAAIAGVSPDKVERFAHPVLLERTRATELAALAHPIRHDGPSVATLGEVVGEGLSSLGQNPAEADWDAWKGEDGHWAVQVSWHVGHTEHRAHWRFQPGSHGGTADPLDDLAEELSHPEMIQPRRRLTPVATPVIAPAVETTEGREKVTFDADSLIGAQRTRHDPLHATVDEHGTYALDFGLTDDTPAGDTPAGGPGRIEVDVVDVEIVEVTVNTVDQPAPSIDARPDQPTTQGAAATESSDDTETDEPAPDERTSDAPATNARRRKSRKPAVPAWEDVLLGVRSNGNS